MAAGRHRRAIPTSVTIQAHCRPGCVSSLPKHRSCGSHPGQCLSFHSSHSLTSVHLRYGDYPSSLERRPRCASLPPKNRSRSSHPRQCSQCRGSRLLPPGHLRHGYHPISLPPSLCLATIEASRPRQPSRPVFALP